MTDPRNKVTTYTADALGNVRTKQDPGGNCAATPKVGCTTYDYEDAYRPTSVTYTPTTWPAT